MTSRPDLSGGVGAAIDAVLAQARVAPGEVAMVALSTTLATNALVEGQGGRVALLAIGFDAADLDSLEPRPSLTITAEWSATRHFGIAFDPAGYLWYTTDRDYVGRVPAGSLTATGHLTDDDAPPRLPAALGAVDRARPSAVPCRSRCRHRRPSGCTSLDVRR